MTGTTGTGAVALSSELIAASSRASSLDSSFERSSSTGSPPAGPGVGALPSLIALAMSEAFHFEYLIFSRFFKNEIRISTRSSISSKGS